MRRGLGAVGVDVVAEEEHQIGLKRLRDAEDALIGVDLQARARAERGAESAAAARRGARAIWQRLIAVEHAVEA